MSGKNIKRKKSPAAPSDQAPVTVFLKKEMVASAEKAVVYDLENEFRGTRKNRGLTTYLSLAGFAVILLAGTFGVTRYIERNTRNIAIEISDFEDINMQELLNTLRNAGKIMAEMKENMEQMKGQMGAEMQKIRTQAYADLEQLKQKHNLSEVKRAALTKKILEDRERRIAEVQSEYKDKLKDKEKSIEDVKKQMSGYKAQLQQKMDSYTEKLEKKLKEYQSESKASKANAEQLVRQMGEDYRVKHLEEKKAYEKKLLELASKMKDVEDSLKAMTGRTGELENMLAYYRRGLMHYAFMRGEQGHVLSVQKDGGLLVVLNPLVELQKSCKGMVINSKGAVIARIEISPKEGMTRASVLKKMSNVPISPFDMIIIQKE